MIQRPRSSALGAATVLFLFVGTACLLLAGSDNGRGQTTPKPAPNQTRDPQAARPDAAKEEPAKAQQPDSKTAKPESSETPKDKAWSILREGVEDKSAERRAKAVRALGLLPGNRVAESIAEKALRDEKSMVRAAAAEALGSMSATHAKRQLRAALNDSDPQVVLAAANALMHMTESAPAYNIYYALLTGKMRGDQGFVKEQLKTVQDPKKLATLGFEEGIGFVPFGGICYSVYKRVLKPSSGGLRAGVAKRLALDPDPLTAQALVAATQDKQWLVRAAALEAISQRGDPALLPQIILPLDDEKDEVRFTAAASVIHLSELPAKTGATTASARK